MYVLLCPFSNFFPAKVGCVRRVLRSGGSFDFKEDNVDTKVLFFFVHLPKPLPGKVSSFACFLLPLCFRSVNCTFDLCFLFLHDECCRLMLLRLGEERSHPLHPRTQNKRIDPS